MPPVSHAPAIVYSSQQNSNRVQTITWGAPTAVASPGNAGGNTPTVDPNGGAAPTYPALLTTDTCVAAYIPALTDRSVQVTGTAGAGGSISIQGSNDGVNFVVLNDVFGGLLSALAPGTLKQINEECAWIKAVVAGGDGTTAMSVIVVGKKSF